MFLLDGFGRDVDSFNFKDADKLATGSHTAGGYQYEDNQFIDEERYDKFAPVVSGGTAKYRVRIKEVAFEDDPRYQRPNEVVPSPPGCQCLPAPEVRREGRAVPGGRGRERVLVPTVSDRRLPDVVARDRATAERSRGHYADRIGGGLCERF